MASNFNRKYELYFGTPAVSKTVFTNTPKETTTNNPMQRYYTHVDPSQSVMVNNLQFKANITRTTKGNNADRTSFEVYNMSKETRKFAELEGALIILKAGYEDDVDLPVVYAGQIKSVSTKGEGENLITYIVAGDGYIPQKNTRISKYYPPYFSKAAIIKDLALSLPGVGEGVFATATLENEFYNSGYSASGKLADVIEKICKAESHEFIMENNRAYVRPLYFGTSSEDFAKLSVRALKFRSNQIKRGSGKMNDNTQDLSNEKSTKAGYEFQLFLDGRVRTSSYIEVADGELAGVYKVIGLKHALDWRGQAWDTIIETEAL